MSKSKFTQDPITWDQLWTGIERAGKVVMVMAILIIAFSVGAYHGRESVRDYKKGEIEELDYRLEVSASTIDRLRTQLYDVITKNRALQQGLTEMKGTACSGCVEVDPNTGNPLSNGVWSGVWSGGEWHCDVRADGNTTSWVVTTEPCKETK